MWHHTKLKDVTHDMSDLHLIFSHPAVSAYANGLVDAPGTFANAVVSFSQRNPNGQGTTFGSAFFASRKIPALFLVQHKNHWWHTDGVLEFAEQAKKMAAERGLGLLTYGSSMGGYGSLHFSNAFGAKKAIAIAPQTFISESTMPEEKRWLDDRKKVELQFDEAESLRSAECESFAFFDRFHAQDRVHIDRMMGAGVGANFVPIDVPYASHDVARALVRVQAFKQFIVNSAMDLDCEIGALKEACASAYQYDDKAFLNRIRGISSQAATVSEKARLLGLASDESRRSLDFEALYFAAEGLMNFGFHDEALVCSSLSLEKYPTKPPQYLHLKHERVLKAFHDFKGRPQPA